MPRSYSYIYKHLYPSEQKNLEHIVNNSDFLEDEKREILEYSGIKFGSVPKTIERFGINGWGWEISINDKNRNLGYVYCRTALNWSEKNCQFDLINAKFIGWREFDISEVHAIEKTAKYLAIISFCLLYFKEIKAKKIKEAKGLKSSIDESDEHDGDYSNYEDRRKTTFETLTDGRDIDYEDWVSRGSNYDELD